MKMDPHCEGRKAKQRKDPVLAQMEQIPAIVLGQKDASHVEVCSLKDRFGGPLD